MDWEIILMMAVLGGFAVPIWGIVFHIHDYTRKKMVVKILKKEKHLLFGTFLESLGFGTFFYAVSSIILYESGSKDNIWIYGWIIFGLVLGGGNYIWHYNRLSKKSNEELMMKFLIDGDPEKDGK